MNRDEPVDADFATRLAELHERLQDNETVDSGALEVEDDLKHQALDALLLIQQVKKDQRDTPAPPEVSVDTHRSIDTQPEPKSGADQPVHFEGQRVGRFELIELIGRGGYGMVFRARDVDVGRDVALKIPRIQIVTSPELETRFVREAKAAGALSHPNIVTVYEAGRDQEVFYIASELVEGQTLAQWLEQSDSLPSSKQVARSMSKLADAMQHAHSRGVLHRDLKPSNILLESPTQVDSSTTGEFGQPRITDFGLAKLEQDASEATQSGMLVGTPAYMSPEQTLGTAKLYATTDVYSLGAVMYELLTGRKPFVAANMLELIKQIQSSDPAMPTKINPSVPVDLQAVCLKCLDKQPERRYSSALELFNDLQRWLSGKPVTARNTTRVERAMRWCRNNPGIATSVISTFVILVAATIISTSLWISASNSNQSALRNSKRLRRAVNDFLTAIAEEPRIKGSGMESFRESLLASANRLYEELREEHPTDDDVLIEYVNTVDRIAQVYGNLGRIIDAQPMIEETQALIESRLPDEKGLLAQMKRYRALIAHDQLDLDGQIDFLNQTVELRRQQFERDPIDQDTMNFVSDLNTLSGALMQRMDVELAKRANDEAIAVLIQWNPDPSKDIKKRLLSGKVSSAAAKIAGRENQFDVARQYALQSIESLKEVDAFEIGDRADAMFALGLSYYSLSRICKASKDRKGYEDNVGHAKAVMDDLVDEYPENPRYLMMKFGLDVNAIRILPHSTPFEEKAAMCQKAIAAVDRAIEAFPQIGLDLLAQKSNFLDHLALLYLRHGDHQLSADAALKSVEIRRQLWEQGDRKDFVRTASLAAGLQQLGSAYQSIGEWQKCFESMTEAIELAQTAYDREGSIELRDLLVKIYVPYVQYLSQAGEFEKCVDECPRLLEMTGDQHLGMMLMMAKTGVERIYLESLWQTGRYDQGRMELERQLKLVDAQDKTGHGRFTPFMLATTLLRSATAINDQPDHRPEDLSLLVDSALELIRQESELPQWQRDQIAESPEFKVLGENVIAELIDPEPDDD